MTYDPNDPADREWQAFVELMFESVGVAAGYMLLWWGVSLVAEFVGDSVWLEHGWTLWQVWLLIAVPVLSPVAWWWLRRHMRALVARADFSPALRVDAAAACIVGGGLLSGSVPALLHGSQWAGVQGSGSWFLLVAINGLWSWWALRLCGMRRPAPGWPPARGQPGAGNVPTRRKRR